MDKRKRNESKNELLIYVLVLRFFFSHMLLPPIREQNKKDNVFVAFFPFVPFCACAVHT